MPNLSDIFKRILAENEIDTVFGIPGGLIHGFFESLSADGRFETYLTKHESSAVFMAQGSYLATGRVALAVATAGPGATNMLTACASALKERIPLVIVTGMVTPFSRFKGASQETHAGHIDVTAMFAQVTKFSAELTESSDVAHTLEKAILLAKTGVPGPVHLAVPTSLWGQSLDDTSSGREAQGIRVCREISHQDAGELAQIIAAAERPLFVVGNALNPSACLALRVYSLCHDIPVLNSPRAKNRYPEAASNCFGHIGLASFATARDILRAADCIIYLGCSMDETETASGDPDLFGATRTIQVCDNLGEVRNSFVRADHTLLGDPNQIVEQLCACASRRARIGLGTVGLGPVGLGLSPSEPKDRRQVSWDIEALCEELEREKSKLLENAKTGVPKRQSEPQPGQRREDLQESLHPIVWREIFSGGLEEDAVVFSDIGAHMLFNLRHINLKPSNAFYLHIGFGSMTSGLLLALGYAAQVRTLGVSNALSLSASMAPSTGASFGEATFGMAAAGTRTYAIIGDACFHMMGMELLTAVENAWPVTYIVENNDMHAITWHGGQFLGYERPFELVVNNEPCSIAAIASKMGLRAHSVSNDEGLRRALADVRTQSGPCLIEVLVDGKATPPPLGDRAKAIAGFRNE